MRKGTNSPGWPSNSTPFHHRGWCNPTPIRFRNNPATPPRPRDRFIPVVTAGDLLNPHVQGGLGYVSKPDRDRVRSCPKSTDDADVVELVRGISQPQSWDPRQKRYFQKYGDDFTTLPFLTHTDCFVTNVFQQSEERNILRDNLMTWGLSCSRLTWWSLLLGLQFSSSSSRVFWPLFLVLNYFALRIKNVE